MKYDVWVKGWWNSHVGIVEADSAEEAMKKAEDLENADPPMLCHQCANGVEIGDVVDIDVEEQTNG